MSACVCARARGCAFADAGARAGARTCVRACEGAHVPVYVSECVGAHASALVGRARKRAGVRAGMRACACYACMIYHILPSNLFITIMTIMYPSRPRIGNMKWRTVVGNCKYLYFLARK